MPWHFAGHLNSSHLGCHKIIRPSTSLFVRFQTCSIQDVQKTSRNLGFAHPCAMGCRLHAKFYVLRPPPELRKLQGRDFERLGSNGLLRPTPWIAIVLARLDCLTRMYMYIYVYIYLYIYNINIYIYLYIIYTLGVLPASLPSMNQVRYCICSTLRCIRTLEGGDW